MRNSSSLLSILAVIPLLLSSMPASASPGDQLAKLKRGDASEFDYFGCSVSIDGDRAVVGAYGNDDNGRYTGAAYLYDVNSGKLTVKLLPDDSAAEDFFGGSVAISGNLVLVGASPKDVNGENSGAAYLFDATTGAQIFRFTPDDSGPEQYFGSSVAIDGNTVVVGAFRDDTNGEDAGAAYIFDAATGQQLQKLLPGDAAVEDEFGTAVAVNGTTAIIGADKDDDRGFASGSAYLFDTTSGVQLAKLLPDDGAELDFFGSAVDIDGTTAIVGAYQHDHDDERGGAAYLFDTRTGTQTAKLLPNRSQKYFEFGNSVAITGTTAIIGAPGARNHGVAFIFDTTTGTQLVKFEHDDGYSQDEFGSAVAIDGTTTVVGAFMKEEIGRSSGAAYLFDAAYCLELNIENLVAGKNATFTITGGTPGARAITVYGYAIGKTVINRVAGYCARFGIRDLNQYKVISGFNRTFDANGEMSFRARMPVFLKGANLFFQTAEHGTCPRDCTSSVINEVVQ